MLKLPSFTIVTLSFLLAACSSDDKSGGLTARGNADPNTFIGKYSLITSYRLPPSTVPFGVELFKAAENPVAAITERLERVFPLASTPGLQAALDGVLTPELDLELVNALALLTNASVNFDVITEFRVQSDSRAIAVPTAIQVKMAGEMQSFEYDFFTTHVPLDLELDGNRANFGEHAYPLPYPDMILRVFDETVTQVLDPSAASFPEALRSVVHCDRLAREVVLEGSLGVTEQEVIDGCNEALDFYSVDLRNLISENGLLEVSSSMSGPAVLDDLDGDRGVDGFRGVWQADIFDGRTEADFAGLR